MYRVRVSPQFLTRLFQNGPTAGTISEGLPEGVVLSFVREDRDLAGNLINFEFYFDTPREIKTLTPLITRTQP